MMEVTRIDFDTAKINAINLINNVSNEDVMRIKTVWENSLNKDRFIKTIIIEIDKNVRKKI